jgi:hypothetical protein
MRRIWANPTFGNSACSQDGVGARSEIPFAHRYFDHYALALDVPLFRQTFLEGDHQMCGIVRRPRA